MPTLTVQQLFDALYDPRFSQTRECYFYICRDRYLALYVGMSQKNVVIRFVSHLTNRDSRLGRIFYFNRPDSLSWEVDFLTVAEAQTILSSRSTGKFRLECKLIQHFKPCLNSKCNPRPTPLPGHYRV